MAIITESKRGSNCTLTDGVPNRVLTLANTLLTQSGGFSVYANGLQLVPTTEYTVSHLSTLSTITFLNVVWDSDYLVVIYVEQGTSTISISYASSTDVYTRTGLTTTEIASATVDILILDAEAELEMICGRKFTNANSYTEFLSFKGKDLIGNYQTKWNVTNWPIQSVTTCNLLDKDGSATTTFDTISAAEILAGTYESDDYWLEVSNDPLVNATKTTGLFTLKTATLPKGTNNLKVTYTYGYASVPTLITDLAATMAGIRCWVVFLGGQYENVNNYNLAEFSVNKGDLYTKGKANMDALKMRADALLDRIGRRARTLFFATGSDR